MCMTRYYFDIRDGDECAADEEGMELPDIEAVKEEAAQSLADVARNAIGSGPYSIEVRDDKGPVLEAKFLSEIKPFKYLH
jgi:hypothetical protein